MLESNFEYGPPEISERSTLYPETTDVLGFQLSTTACETNCVPTPEREIVAGELEALLPTVTLPVKFPADTGVNVSFRVADCPGDRIKPAETPLPE